MTAPIRIIPRIDVRGEHVVKGVHLEGVRKVGLPGELATKYAAEGADEILFMDVVASLYGRNNLLPVVREAARGIFIPLTVGGGIRSIDDIVDVLRNGGDKVAINTEGLNRPEFLRQASKILGSQCIIVSIEAKRTGDDQWEAYSHNGREKTGKNAVEWAKEAEQLGAGEVLITSIDHEGTMKGFDLQLIEQVYDAVAIPVTVCGGAGKTSHLIDLAQDVAPDAICCASLLHFNKASLPELKSVLSHAGVSVRL